MSRHEYETIRIGPATPAMAGELTALAERSKRHWGYPEAWLQAWRPQLTLSEEYVRSGEVHAAFQGGELVGFHALEIEGERAVLEHLWVDPRCMGGGVGRSLLGHAVARARECGALWLEIESDPNAEGFYLRHGAIRAGVVPAPVCGEPRELPLLRMDLGEVRP